MGARHRHPCSLLKGAALVSELPVADFSKLFAGNPAGFYYRNADGKYAAVHRPPTDADFLAHLNGTPDMAMLSVPLLPDGTTAWGAIDLDRHGENDPQVNWPAMALRVTELKMPLVVCRSQGGKGAWLILFLKSPILAADMQRILGHYARVLSLGTVEIFPKQPDLDTEKKLGNGINLPYFGKQRIAFAENGEELNLDGFVALAHRRQLYGNLLLRDLPEAPSPAPTDSGSAFSADKSWTEGEIRKRYEEKLAALRAAPEGTGNNILNEISLIAARVCASKVFDKTEQQFKQELLDIVCREWRSPHPEQSARSTINSGWKKGLSEGPYKLLAVMRPTELSRPDMPEAVLDGQLGQWCRTRLHDFPIALAWPAILAAASVLVEQGDGARCNLNVCLVADPHHGKTQAQERANFLFRLNDLGRLDENKYGSAEGLLEQVGDRNGNPLLWFPDELSHLLEKAQIQGASFPYILNTLFYKDHNDLTVQHRKKVRFNARLSIAGGVVEQNFGDSFGAATTAGLYDRFLFGLFPTGNFEYVYRPMQGGPVVELRPSPADQTAMNFGPEQSISVDVRAPKIDPSVWDARDEIQKSDKIESRVLELAIRVAMVCAAWDGKPMLRASDLGPAWELARYQQRVRQILQPNTGRNFEAMAAFKILDYLKRYADGEKYIPWRDVLRGTKVAEFGPSVAERAVSTMIFAGEIDEATVRPEKGGRAKRLVRLAVQ
jgi:hypothetical protein